MSQYIRLSEKAHELAQQAAEENNCSIEDFVSDLILILFGPSPDELDLAEIETLSDERLWILVNWPFALARQTRLWELTARSKEDGLSEAENTELEQLIDKWDDYILRRSTALLILKQRGHDVEERLGWRIR